MPQRMNRRGQRGLGLVEMMVGLTIGLIVTAGAIMLTTNQLADHRRLVLETQVQQDLRAAADLMLRELRRTGFWVLPQNGVWASGQSLERSAYGTVALTEKGDGLTYDYSVADDRKTSSPKDPEDNLVNDTKERFGVRLQDGTLQFRTGGKWQPLTDPATLQVTSFDVSIRTQSVPLEEFCPKPCPAGTTCAPFVQELRSVNIQLSGRAVHDAAVVRTVRLTTRIRNDVIDGSCPA